MIETDVAIWAEVAACAYLALEKVRRDPGIDTGRVTE
jgi:hypothetical protein